MNCELKSRIAIFEKEAEEIINVIFQQAKATTTTYQEAETYLINYCCDAESKVQKFLGERAQLKLLNEMKSLELKK